MLRCGVKLIVLVLPFWVMTALMEAQLTSHLEADRDDVLHLLSLRFLPEMSLSLSRQADVSPIAKISAKSHAPGGHPKFMLLTVQRTTGPVVAAAAAAVSTT
jgi:hypothetical protein